ncbi:hypothetical protein [Nonlabens antarcticus]|uniref:hypothetical protein n=1 Tax=Nonlabens antarcticus TaxID=392714 RepID=UPI0018915DCC|nr:hypothetical protein [Nonlabens antarcticus]
MRLFLAIISLLLLNSCKTETQKNDEATTQAMDRFKNLDTKSVDVFPQFVDCDELETTSDCFYARMHELIQTRLSTDTLNMEIKQKDSLVAVFTVTDKGQIRYDSIAYCANHLDRTFMDSTLNSKLVDLPKIDSALKQGVPVASSYLVPVVVQPINAHSDQ